MNQALTLPGIGDLVDGKFRIERKLGEGGTSTVYEVSHIITDRRFAIKWLLPELALDDTAVERFIREARVTGKFTHPYAVQVYDICRANDSFYMLMELLQGESLLTRLERLGRLPVADACSIMLACCEVLVAAHQAGIIHRDLKPANIFLCAADSHRGERPKLLDFGIATFCHDLQQSTGVITQTRNVIGTPLYMAPEQMLGGPVDARTDIYALGAVLYELVSGKPPYEAESYVDLATMVAVEGSPKPLAETAQVDPAFAAIVAKAMAREPADRYPTVHELMLDLLPFAGGLTEPQELSGVHTAAGARMVIATPATAADPAPVAAAAEYEQADWSRQQHPSDVSPHRSPRGSKNKRRSQARELALVVSLGALMWGGWTLAGRSSKVQPIAVSTQLVSEAATRSGEARAHASAYGEQSAQDALPLAPVAPSPNPSAVAKQAAVAHPSKAPHAGVAKRARKPAPQRTEPAAPARISTRRASATNADTLIHGVRIQRSDFGGLSATAPMPAASVHRQDF